MSGLAFAQAPPPSVPMRFLATALAWGALAGCWLAWHGDVALLSRWTPATLVLVHLFALGLLGNAMLGSLVQFLPVAAGSPLPCARVVPCVHATFNLGLALLLATLATSSHALAAPAAVLLGGSLALFAALALVAVVRGSGVRVVRDGIGLAVLALMATAMLGLVLLAARTGWRMPAAAGMVDVHAAFGVIGWTMGLLAAVGAVTLPMLQGTRAPPVAAARAWQIGVLLTLCVIAADTAGALPVEAMRLAAWPFAVFAAAVFVLQARAPHRRNAMLRAFWRAGCAALLLAGVLSAWPGAAVVVTGTLVLGVGLPLLVVGMAMEITGFLTWIALRQRVPRGVRVPGVGTLFDEGGKRRALFAHVIAGGLLVSATLVPVLARIAGGTLVLAYAMSLHALWRCWRLSATWQARASG
ncbi:hypothetical protein [Pseudoxanthomonas sp. Root630]|uniref:hypothetical protein n=1 Tax=Pseudoxanthomonas sp. Root630 TaxID=1736574 RepID=UPI0007038D85|nr:hypothetical protein [Pseudoxanthomonas sp. Root630]KRA45237.1 hypothetical protein ASD72_08250 [Pseudoxanthomonas sp. Root630]